MHIKINELEENIVNLLRILSGKLPRPYGYHLFPNLIKKYLYEYFTKESEIKVVKELQLIQKNRKTCWFLPTITWYSNAFQRPHQLAKALSEVGLTIIFIEPWKDQFDLNQLAIKERRFQGLKILNNNLYLLRCPGIFIPYFLKQVPPNFIYCNWPYQKKFIPDKFLNRVIFDIMDDYDINPDLMIHWKQGHNILLKEALKVFVTADLLYQKFSKSRDDVIKIPNAVYIPDWEYNGNTLPKDYEYIRQFERVYIYYGALAHWFDWELWNYAATQYSNSAFVLIGYPYELKNVDINVKIKNNKNIYFLGPKPYKMLASYLYYSDVATIPFIVNNITNSTSPVKLFEYMAARKPIVTTNFYEVRKYRSALLSRNKEEFCNNLDKAYTLKNNANYLELLRAEAEENTWQARAKTILSNIN